MLLTRCVSIVLSLLLAFPATFWSGVAHAVTSEDADLVLGEKLARTEVLAGELRQAINRSVYDLDALLDTLEYDHESIIRFVREGIAFEQYRGLLRGPRGTLMSQAGNSLDQAVLLAKLLRDAGFEARVARGTLDESGAQILLRQMKRARPAAGDLGDVAQGIEVIKKYGLMTSLGQAQTQQVEQALERPPVLGRMSEFETFQSTTVQLQGSFSALAVNPGGELDAQLLDEAKDYYWVEAKVDAADAWQDIHPSLTDDVSVKPRKVSTISTVVPEELQHRVRLQMSIERLAGGKSTTVPVMDAWERPVANLVGLPVLFTVLPDSALDPANAALSPDEVIAKANYFVPMLFNGPAPGAQYFDLAANKIDPMVAGQPAAGVFKKVGRSFGDAAGALGGKSVVPRLGAVWIDITLIAPGGEETKYRRTITGTVASSGTAGQGGEDGRLASFLPLLRVNTLVVAAGRTPRGMAVDNQLAQWQQTLPGIKALVWGLKDNPNMSTADKSSLGEVPGHWLGHLAMLSRFDLVEDWSDQHRLYRHEPLLAIHTTGVNGNQGSMARVDIVHNARRAFDITGPEPSFDARAQIAGGVWETLAEGSMLQPGDRKGAMQVLQAASSQKIPLRTIKPGGAIGDLPVDGETRLHLQADLERGYAVLIPEARPDGHQHIAWWRIDPVTGETLGVFDDGRGTNLTEYMSPIIAIAGLGFLHYSLYGCFSQAYGNHDSNVSYQLTCCVLFNYGAMLLMTIFSALIGLKLADLATDMVGLSVDVLDFGLGLDGMFCEAILN